MRLWDENPRLPILFISGNPPESLEPGVTLEAGWNFLRKPFSVTELLERIDAPLRLANIGSAEDKRESTAEPR